VFDAADGPCCAPKKSPSITADGRAPPSVGASNAKPRRVLRAENCARAAFPA
jgi:hypothetical protein